MEEEETIDIGRVALEIKEMEEEGTKEEMRDE